MIATRALRHAAVFHAIAKTGSIAETARQLGRTPSAIHHDLKSFEAELGRPLFGRVGRSLRLLPGAFELYQSISRGLDEIERSRQRFEYGSGELETIRLAVVSAFGRYVLVPRLFAAIPPRQPLELFMNAHEKVVEALLAHQVDFAVTYRPVSVVQVEALPVAEEEYVLVGPAAFACDSDLTTLERQGFITYDEYEYVFGRWFDQRFGRQPRRLRRLDHTTELEEALESVAAGRGLTIVPADAWRGGSTRDRCTQLFPEEARATNTLFLLCRAEAPSAPKTRIIELLRDLRSSDNLL